MPATLAGTPAGTPRPTPLPPPTPGPRIFTIGLAQAPGTLDPANAVDESALVIARHLYEGLTAYAPGATRAVPALAESWEVSADGLAWTFRLRPNVRFGDGTPLTAQAAARNFERWLDRAPPGEYAFWRLMFGGFAGEADENGDPLSRLAKVEARDEATLVLSLHRPDASLPNTLAMPSFALVNPAAFEAGSFGAPGGAGTGAFVLRQWTADGIVHLVRNPNYWGNPPAPDELVFKVIPDDTQRLLALHVGEIEAMAHLNPKDFAVATAGPETRMEFDPALDVLYLGFNQAHAPWANPECRLAVAHALDKARYVREFFPGDADVAQAMQPPGVWGAPQDASHGERAYDPAQAEQHWQACLGSGTEVPQQITLYVPPVERPYLPNPAGLGAAIQADLAKVGIQAQIASPDWRSAWLPDVHSGRADLFLLGWVGVNGDPDSFLCPLFCGAEAAFNSDEEGKPLPPDPDLAALLASARATTDPAQREQLYLRAHERILETVPAIPLAYRKTAWAYRANVRGNIPSPIEDVFFNLALAP